MDDNINSNEWITLEFDALFLVKCRHAIDATGLKVAYKVTERFCKDHAKAMRRCNFISKFLFLPWIKDCSIIIELCYLYGGRRVFAAIKFFQGDYIGSELNLRLYNLQLEEAKKKFGIQ